MKPIETCLWFDNQAEEAARFYVSVFAPHSALGPIAHYSDAGPRPAGSVLTVEFTLREARFFGLNGGPHYSFTPAVSLSVACADQAEIDHFWDRLGDGGEAVQCGWLRDRYGLSWQIAPAFIPAMIRDPDRARATRVMRAVMGMIKLDAATLQRAYEG